MQLDFNGNKGFRMLNIYERLNKGECLSKSDLADSFGVTAKTIQRDIEDLRIYLSEIHLAEIETCIKYDKARNIYYLVRFEREWLTNEEVLALCKILLESRALNKQELKSLIDKLLLQVVPNDRKLVEHMILSEQYHYVPLKHNKPLLSPIWQLSQHIKNQEVIDIAYTRKDGISKEYPVNPVSLMFSEFYFYLVCFMADDSKDFPTILRIDRINNIKSSGKKFNIPYTNKFKDGEFRKRIQFMFSGELQKVQFEYNGPSIEAVLDKLPTAEIIEQQGNTYVLRVECYGDGIYMWLRSQGDQVRVI